MTTASKAVELSLKNILIKFGEQVVLENVNLEVHEGEAVVLVGPSGQGKSVLLKTMAGLLTPAQGEIQIRGKSWLSMDSSQKKDILFEMGMLFQKNALFDSMTVYDNVAFPLRIVRNMAETEIRPLVEKYLKAVGLDHVPHNFPDEISGGMQKRLGIARALILEPKIIFYDDPTAGLDPITSKKIIELIIDLRKKNGSTVIAVTNDMNRAFQLADRMALVGAKKLIVTGTPKETQASQQPEVRSFIRGEYRVS